VFRECGRDGFVIDLVRAVGEEGFRGAEFLGDGYGFFDREMGGMGDETEGVDNQEVEVFHEWPSFVGDGFDITKVGEGLAVWSVDAVAVAGLSGVNDGERSDGEAAEFDGGGYGNGVGLDVAGVALGAVVCEGPRKHALKGG